MNVIYCQLINARQRYGYLKLSSFVNCSICFNIFLSNHYPKKSCKMIQQIIVLLLAFTFVSASLPFTDCGSTFEVRDLRISGCEAIPCLFRRGDTHVIEMDVTSSKCTVHIDWISPSLEILILVMPTVFFFNLS